MLTLPGIAGVILTIGMGVDSNVLIFERIREELRAGKTAAASVQQGFGPRLDHHRGHPRHHHRLGRRFCSCSAPGPVKGFAVTLTFGLLANLFTAVFVSRTIFDAHSGEEGTRRSVVDLESSCSCWLSVCVANRSQLPDRKLSNGSWSFKWNCFVMQISIGWARSGTSSASRWFFPWLAC